jgi:phosphatidylglycerophosphate synthase
MKPLLPQPLASSSAPASSGHDSTVPPQRLWDARLARWLVTPLANTSITPNVLTTIRLLIGLASVAAFAIGSFKAANIGALLLALSNFLDHTDGELARVSGKSSPSGHLYDLYSDIAIHVLLFLAIGIGLREGSIGAWSCVLGLVAATAVAIIFLLRLRIEDRVGKSGVRQPSIGGLELEDVLYLSPLLTLSSCLPWFLAASSIGAPLYAIFVVREYRRVFAR